MKSGPTWLAPRGDESITGFAFSKLAMMTVPELARNRFACALTRALTLGIPLLGRECVEVKVG
jgi:hypothetical protein